MFVNTSWIPGTSTSKSDAATAAITTSAMPFPASFFLSSCILLSDTKLTGAMNAPIVAVYAVSAFSSTYVLLSVSTPSSFSIGITSILNSFVNSLLKPLIVVALPMMYIFSIGVLFLET